MFLTKKARYAVMAMLEMANRDTGDMLKLSDIAKAQGIDLSFLEQIFAKLKKADLIESVRGPGGGYRLSKSSREISVSQIMKAIEEEVKITKCGNTSASENKRCLNHGKSICATHHLWSELERNIDDYFKSKTLFDICNKKDQRGYIYFDHNATTDLLPEVKEGMLELYQVPLNASSVHKNGRIAKNYIESARVKVKNMVCAADDYKVIFTSSGTEANNLAILGCGKNGYFPIVSTIEHSSVLDIAGQGLIDVMNDGLVNLDYLEKVLSLHDGKAIVSVMLANNETGVIQPIAEISKIVHKYNCLLHTDATQCPGKILIDISKLNPDMMTISAHKFGGPLGAAALIYKQGIDLYPIIIGGGQEYRLRSGTHNVQAIHGFGIACEAEPLYRKKMEEKKILRDYIEDKILQLCKDAIVFGKGSLRLPNTASISMPSVNASSQVMHFDIDGVAVSAGSACSSGTAKLPHVHMAMGYDEAVAKTAIRISLGIKNTKAEADAFINSWNTLYSRSWNNSIIQKAI